VVDSVRGLWMFVMLAALVGCRTPSVATESGIPDYEHLQLVYDVNSQFRSLPLTSQFVTGLQGESSLADELGLDEKSVAETPSQSEGWKGVRLQIDYPHPDGFPGLARATLRLTTRPEPVYSPIDGRPFQIQEAPLELDTLSARACDDELWTLDIPRQQLNALVAELNSNGFFRSQLRPEVGTRLAVQIDGHSPVERNWTPEPQLDEVVHRVHTAGHLRGFVSRDADRTVTQTSWSTK